MVNWISGIAIENKGEFKVYLYKREEEIAMVTPNFGMTLFRGILN